jgi:hypothetical protein
MNSKYFATGYSDRPMEKKDIIRELVYLKADLLLPAKAAVVMKPVPILEMKYDIPRITTIAPDEISEGTRSPRRHMEFWQMPVSLRKYQTTVMTTDEAKARMMGAYQTSMTVQAVSTGMAQAIDSEIFATLVAATGQTVTAGAKWDASAASPATDVASILGKIFDNTNIMDSDLGSIQIYCPAKVWSFLKMPKDTGLLYMTVKTWMEREQQVTITPTRRLTTDALVVLPGEQTAHHLTYNGTDIPTAEARREEGVGDEFIITRYYTTVVIPEEEGGTTTSRLGLIKDVCS